MGIVQKRLITWKYMLEDEKLPASLSIKLGKTHDFEEFSLLAPTRLFRFP